MKNKTSFTLAEVNSAHSACPKKTEAEWDINPNQCFKSKYGKFRLKSYKYFLTTQQNTFKSWIASIQTDFAMTKIISFFLSPLPLGDSGQRACEGFKRKTASTLAEVFSPHPTCQRKYALTLAEVFSPHPTCQRKCAFTLAEVFSPYPTCQRKYAFTLAEVLITLGIIGVVAAMTLPTLINNIKHKELETAFKKSYSTLSQTVQKVMLEDYGGTYDYNLTNLINNIQKYYIKSASCLNGNKCSSSIFPVENFSSTSSGSFMFKNYRNFIGKNSDSRFNDGIIAATDGSFIFFDIGGAAEITYGTVLIGIDVNGWRKKPNRYGHDFFVFQLDSKGRLLPMGREETFFPEEQYCSRASNAASNGQGCTAKALNAPDYFKNLPK